MSYADTRRNHLAGWITAMQAVGLLTFVGAASATVPLAPGSPEATTVVEVRCPTFHWTLDAPASAYELAVYELTATAGDPAPEEAPPVLDQRLPAGATGWTPPVGRCLEPGRRYAWFVRSEGDGVPGPWSDGNLFEIAGPASAEAAEPAAPGRGREDRDADAGRQSLAATATAPPAGAGADPSPAAAASAGGASLAPKALPPAAFNVSGDTRITGEYAFSQPRRVRRIYSAAQFQLQQRSAEDDDWVADPAGYGRFSGGVGALEVPLILPLDDLPPGAEIKSFACVFMDNDAGANSFGAFTLRRRSRSSSFFDSMAVISIDTAGASPFFSFRADSTVAFPFVEEAPHYWIEGTFRAEAVSSNLRFYGCELEYEVERLDTR